MTEQAAGEQTGVQQAYREAVPRIGPGPAPHDTNVPGPGAPSAGSGAPSRACHRAPGAGRPEPIQTFPS
jgi:hypothetical protein